MIIALLTMFRTLRPTYSLVHVVESQIYMLLEQGMKVRLLVSESCPEEERYGIYLDERVEWVKVTNTLDGNEIIWHDYSDMESELHSTFEEEAQVIAEDLVDKLKDVDVCMMHDILYQGMHYLHNRAIRIAAKKLNHLGFLAFSHSYPMTRPVLLKEDRKGMYSSMPNTLLAYPTRSGVSALAKQYGVPEGLCKVVYHPMELIEKMSETVQKLHATYDILSPDVLIVYPARMSIGKKLDKVAALAGAIKTIGEVSVKVVFCDFVGPGEEGEHYKEQVKCEGIKYGLEENEMIFTSEEGYEQGIARDSVLELFSLSNLYICPSMSESFGLTVIEAARMGNLLVLNENVLALKEIGTQLDAYFMKWDARREEGTAIENYRPSEPAYYGAHAAEILKKMKADSVIKSKTKVRQGLNSRWIWYHQLEPALEEAIARARMNNL